jgi:hypothetical protein
MPPADAAAFRHILHLLPLPQPSPQLPRPLLLLDSHGPLCCSQPHCCDSSHVYRCSSGIHCDVSADVFSVASCAAAAFTAFGCQGCARCEHACRCSSHIHCNPQLPCSVLLHLLAPAAATLIALGSQSVPDAHAPVAGSDRWRPLQLYSLL